MVCISASDPSSPILLPSEPMITSIQYSWVGVDDRGLSFIYARCNVQRSYGSSMWHLLKFKADFETLFRTRFRKFRVFWKALNALRSLVILSLGPQAS